MKYDNHPLLLLPQTRYTLVGRCLAVIGVHERFQVKRNVSFSNKR